MRTLRPEPEDKFTCRRCGRPTSKVRNPYFRSGQGHHEFYRLCKRCDHIMIAARDMENFEEPEVALGKPEPGSWLRWLRRRQK
jgi:hypothetical protein